MHHYLARMFNHAATIINVFGWDIGDRDGAFRPATESDEAIAARQFLTRRASHRDAAWWILPQERFVLQRRMRVLTARIEDHQRRAVI